MNTVLRPRTLILFLGDLLFFTLSLYLSLYARVLELPSQAGELEQVANPLPNQTYIDRLGDVVGRTQRQRQLVVIRSNGGERIVHAADFFIGPDVNIQRMTVLKPGEMKGMALDAAQAAEQAAGTEMHDPSMFANAAAAARREMPEFIDPPPGDTNADAGTSSGILT